MILRPWCDLWGEMERRIEEERERGPGSCIWNKQTLPRCALIYCRVGIKLWARPTPPRASALRFWPSTTTCTMCVIKALLHPNSVFLVSNLHLTTTTLTHPTRGCEKNAWLLEEFKFFKRQHVEAALIAASRWDSDCCNGSQEISRRQLTF